MNQCQHFLKLVDIFIIWKIDSSSVHTIF